MRASGDIEGLFSLKVQPCTELPQLCMVVDGVGAHQPDKTKLTSTLYLIKRGKYGRSS